MIHIGLQLPMLFVRINPRCGLTANICKLDWVPAFGEQTNSGFPSKVELTKSACRWADSLNTKEVVATRLKMSLQ